MKQKISIRIIGFIITITLFLLWNTCHSANRYHHPEEFLASLAGKDQQTVGKAVYQQFCSTCHAKKPTIPLGAPRIGVTEDWQSRQALRTPQAMLKRIDAGLNAMPARGGCFECSDQQLLDAIHYLLPKTKRK